MLLQLVLLMLSYAYQHFYTIHDITSYHYRRRKGNQMNVLTHEQHHNDEDVSMLMQLTYQYELLHFH
jgi:hypothetical protein